MSPEKLQLLLAQLDKVRIAAEDAARECGMPERVIAPFFMRPMPACDWLLELSKKFQDRNPGLMNFMTEHMPEPRPDQIQRTPARIGIVEPRQGERAGTAGRKAKVKNGEQAA